MLGYYIHENNENEGSQIGHTKKNHLTSPHLTSPHLTSPHLALILGLIGTIGILSKHLKPKWQSYHLKSIQTEGHDLLYTVMQLQPLIFKGKQIIVVKPF